jgi:PHD/YefM family antitoxin component YafN of YafNO toxin-antitoxin module
MAFHQQILRDNNGNNIGVFMPLEDYEKIMDQLEELEDIRDFDAAIVKNEEIIPLKEAMKLRKQKNG